MKDQREFQAFEYAKSRVKQRKLLFFHFVVFVLGSILLYCVNNFIQDPILSGVWWTYAVGIWAVLLFLHIVNVVIVNRFMGKEWQDKQIIYLVELQKQKIEELRKKVEKDFPLVDVKRDLKQSTTTLSQDTNQDSSSIN